MKSTFIKLDRNILNWRWYGDANTFRLFVHLLLTANIKKSYLREVVVERGEAVTSYEGVANTLGLTKQQVRTAFRHLILTGEITVRRYSKFSVIRIVNYETYQNKQHSKEHAEQHSGNTQPTDEQHHPKNERNKELKNISDGDVSATEFIDEGSDFLRYKSSLDKLPEDVREKFKDTCAYLTSVFWGRRLTEYDEVSIYSILISFCSAAQKPFEFSGEDISLLTKAFESSAKADACNVGYIGGVFRKFKEREIFTIRDYEDYEYEVWKERDRR